MSVANAYRILFLCALIWFSILLLITLFRSIIGPRVTDRILSINMICTMVIACTCITAYLLDESYLFDVALLYALLSFITVLILSATYIPRTPTRRRFSGRKKAAMETAGAAALMGAAGTGSPAGAAVAAGAGTGGPADTGIAAGPVSSPEEVLPEGSLKIRGGKEGTGE